MIVRHAVRGFTRKEGVLPRLLVNTYRNINKGFTQSTLWTASVTSVVGRDIKKRRFTSTSQRSSLTDEYDSQDVVVIGGGVVGLSLACSLATDRAFRSSGSSITLVEGSPMDRLRQWHTVKKNGEQGIDDWENRAIYLTEENSAWLNSLGVEPFLLKARLRPIRSMHVTDGLTGAALDFDAPNENSAPLGVMAEISNLQQALLRRIEELNVEKGTVVRICDNSRVQRIEAMMPGTGSQTNAHVDAWPNLHFDGNSSLKPLRARLLIGADGHNSPVRRYAGIDAHGWSYDRMGVVGTLKIQGLDEGQIAFQRFLPTGTIAWLPLSQEYASMVWTLPPDVAKGVIELQKAHESSNSISPIAALINAAFRLPWSDLQLILEKVKGAATETDISNTNLLSDIQERLAVHEMNTDIMQSFNGPPPVQAILPRSVAGFPLKLSHAESYLGSSLRRTTLSEAGAAAITPSNLLHGALSLASRMTSQEEPPVGLHHGRTALIGDAAHTIHPLAGQGLNLGIADARSLSSVIVQAVQEGGDIGSHVSLQAYPRQRYLANQAVLSAVDHLHWLFVTPPPGQPSNSIVGDLFSRGVVWARSTGFEVLNELDVVKKAIIGAAGSSPSKRR